MTKTSELAWEMAIADCPDDVLQAEVIRREHEKKEAEIPKVRPHIDAATLQPLANICQSYIDQLAEEEPYADDKLRQYAFEAAMEVFYGKGVWEWIKKRLQ